MLIRSSDLARRVSRSDRTARRYLRALGAVRVGHYRVLPPVAAALSLATLRRLAKVSTHSAPRRRRPGGRVTVGAASPEPMSAGNKKGGDKSSQVLVLERISDGEVDNE